MKQPAYEKPEGRDAAEALTVEEDTVVELLTMVESVVAEDAEVDDAEVLVGADELLDDEEDEVIVLEADELLDDEEDSLVLVIDETDSELLLVVDVEVDIVLEAEVVVLLLGVTEVAEEEVPDERLSDEVDVLAVWL